MAVFFESNPTKKAPRKRDANSGELVFVDINRLRTAIGLFDFERYRLAFFKRLVAITLDCREVYEYIATVFASDEPVTLFSVEPFHSAVFH
jgi:hypothetical protein